MRRKEFIKMCALFGIQLPFSSSLLACSNDDDEEVEMTTPPSEKIIVIGAGVGGLSSGYFLNQRGIDFEILEASPRHGGRIRTNTDFADFPIPLGAEWIETDLGIFDEIVNDPSVQVDVPTFADAPDQKFLDGSWLNFFEEYIVPSISDKILYNTVVQSIDYSGEQIIVRTQDGERMADKVILSVPLQILRNGDISFTPSLPQQKLDAIDNIEIWDGFKAFFEFSTNFYGDGQEFRIRPASDGEKLYYDATFGQNSTQHILGLFVVGKPAQDYTSRSGDDLKSYILSELDDLFSNQATPAYLKYVTQNWSKEPFIRSGYVSDHADWRMVRELGKSVDNKLYFAGGAYTDGEDWVSVHAAARSAKVAIESI